MKLDVKILDCFCFYSNITFNGKALTGRLPLIDIRDIDAFVDIDKDRNVTTGDDIYGWFTLQYQLRGDNQHPTMDVGNTIVTPECEEPEFDHPVNATCLGVNSNPESVKAILEGFDELCHPDDRNTTNGCFDVTFIPKKGVGVIWEITFARGRKGLGSRPTFSVANDQTRYISRAGTSDNVASVTVEKVQDVSRVFLSGILSSNNLV